MADNSEPTDISPKYMLINKKREVHFVSKEVDRSKWGSFDLSSDWQAEISFGFLRFEELNKLIDMRQGRVLVFDKGKITEAKVTAIENGAFEIITKDFVYKYRESFGKKVRFVLSRSMLDEALIISGIISDKVKSHYIYNDIYVKANEVSSLSKKERDSRSRIYPKIPHQVEVVVNYFIRNPYVVYETLCRANGECELCHNPAPFNRSSDGTPYLEVHHKKPLSEGGEDTAENAIALCPNCHRREHYG